MDQAIKKTLLAAILMALLMAFYFVYIVDAQQATLTLESAPSPVQSQPQFTPCGCDQRGEQFTSLPRFESACVAPCSYGDCTSGGERHCNRAMKDTGVRSI